MRAQARSNAAWSLPLFSRPISGPFSRPIPHRCPGGGRKTRPCRRRCRCAVRRARAACACVPSRSRRLSQPVLRGRIANVQPPVRNAGAAGEDAAVHGAGTQMSAQMSAQPALHPRATPAASQGVGCFASSAMPARPSCRARQARCILPAPARSRLPPAPVRGGMLPGRLPAGFRALAVLRTPQLSAYIALRLNCAAASPPARRPSRTSGGPRRRPSRRPSRRPA